MKIQHIIQAMNISRQMNIATGRKLKSIDILSSGLPIRIPRVF
jgi:flagellin-like hook-associated protein FlgL